MKEKIICEKCGNEMTAYIRGSSCGMECSNCGWGCATTYTDPIKLDNADYTLCITPVENPSIEIIRCIAQLLSCNFLCAKKKLQQKIIITDKAPSIRSIITELDKNNITYVITPDFPY